MWFRPSAAAALIAALVAAVPAAAQHTVTVDDLMSLRSIADVSISPDGAQVAYVLSTPDLAAAAHDAVLYRVPAAGGKPVRLTYGTHVFNRPLPAPRLRWSPDGRLISFIGLVDGTPQVMAIAAGGGEARPLTSFEGGVTQYEWSPDGHALAFLAQDPMSAEERHRRAEHSWVDRSNAPPRRPRLWVQAVPPGGTGAEASRDATAAGAPRAITPADQTVLDFGWAPDSRRLVYSASAAVGFEAPYTSTIYTVATAGGAPRVLVRRTGTNRMASWSPDGRWIAFVSTGGKPGMVQAEDLYVVPADGSAAPRGLTVARQIWTGEYAWAPDSRSLYYIPNEQTNASGEHMFEQGIYRVGVDGGPIELVTPGRIVAFSLSLSADGKRLAYKAVEPRTNGDVFVRETAGGEARRLTDVNPQLRGWALGDLEPVHWKARDGQQIWGLLLTPPGYRPGTRIPLVVYVHGGPIGGFTYGIFPQFGHIPGQVTPYPVEAMAGAGMAILQPMPRGGSGYGVAGFRAIMNSWGETDYRDIMAGVNAMVARGIADPARLGIMGASYGGYMTDWAVTQTDRFKAASAGASTCDLIALYYGSEGGDFVAEYFGLPWEDGKALVQHSPITFVRNVHTPLLLQHGEADPRVPVAQAHEFYKALTTLHRTVELDLYPRGGHVNFEPPLEREYMLRNLQWFEHWLGVAPRAAGEDDQNPNQN